MSHCLPGQDGQQPCITTALPNIPPLQSTRALSKNLLPAEQLVWLQLTAEMNFGKCHDSIFMLAICTIRIGLMGQWYIFRVPFSLLSNLMILRSLFAWIYIFTCVHSTHAIHFWMYFN